MTKFHIFRFDPKADAAPRFQDYEVPEAKGMTVLDGLIHILEELDPSLAYRSSCRAAICGSCAMHISGRYRLACQTQIGDVARQDQVVIRPLSHLPVLRDLVVDMGRFFENWRRIRPHLVAEGPAPERERLQTPKERARLDSLVDCIMCGACYGACPSARDNAAYLGPHALLKALRFIEDSRDGAGEERLSLAASDDGVFRCHSVFNCQTVCPKELDPAAAISRIKRRALGSRLKPKLARHAKA